ncbi:MAG: AAA family ATPase, partial [Alphaproteobacteria bacterium]|nr:AAA family ATPase [Alphaproteobacteria bacterium]
MGQFIDNGNFAFQRIKNSDFVDKSGLLNILNKNLDTESSFMCISRPRRFGKSVAAKMAYAYYDRKSDSKELFNGLEITKSPDYEKHLNKYPTIFIDWNTFANIPVNDVLKVAQQRIVADLKKSYTFLEEQNDLYVALAEINEKTGDRFVLIIDEWDMLVRDVEKDVQDAYVDFLRSMFKSYNASNIFRLVYMTGILPIIKIKTQSALNNFVEYSIIDPGDTDKYYGFTDDEVKILCQKHNMNFDLMKHAYDGYIIGNQQSMFNPFSVMQSILKRNYNSFWSKTASFMAIESYLAIDADQVRTKIIEMMDGEKVVIDSASFRVDITKMISYVDVLSLLIHLGYLTYNHTTQYVTIPNTEIKK